jgi:hypothetical protein
VGNFSEVVEIKIIPSCKVLKFAKSSAFLTPELPDAQTFDFIFGVRVGRFADCPRRRQI